MLDSNGDSTRVSLGFIESVTRDFSFVAMWGFRLTNAVPTLVRYESDEVLLNVYHGRSSYEVGAELGPVSGPDRDQGNQEKFTIWEVMRYLGDQTYDDKYFIQASSSESVDRAVLRLSDLVKLHLPTILVNSKAFFEGIREWQLGETQRFLNEGGLRRARQKAVDAWRNKEYSEYIRLLKPFSDHLDRLELSKLKYAAGHDGSTDVDHPS